MFKALRVVFGEVLDSQAFSVRLLGLPEEQTICWEGVDPVDPDETAWVVAGPRVDPDKTLWVVTGAKVDPQMLNDLVETAEKLAEVPQTAGTPPLADKTGKGKAKAEAGSTPTAATPETGERNGGVRAVDLPGRSLAGSRMTKVFVSYAHSSPEHMQTVSTFVETLRGNGLMVMVDTDVKTPQGPEEGWPRWMKRQIKEADWVLMFFDELYRRRFDGEEEPDKGLGATWEGAIITHHYYRNSTKNEKFIPLLADGAGTDLIPDELFGYTRYSIPSQTIELAAKLRPPNLSETKAPTTKPSAPPAEPQTVGAPGQDKGPAAVKLGEGRGNAGPTSTVKGEIMVPPRSERLRQSAEEIRVLAEGIRVLPEAMEAFSAYELEVARLAGAKLYRATRLGAFSDRLKLLAVIDRQEQAARRGGNEDWESIVWTEATCGLYVCCRTCAAQTGIRLT